MMRFEKFVLILMCLAVFLPVRQVFATPEEQSSDVRILIDVSGSMKKNDPNNLRAPALRLILGLLPDDAKAGVWTFAKYVNMLIPVRDVDDAWKLEAEKQTSKIHSYGLYTNIEQALNKATASHDDKSETTRKSVILLSDGLVDLAKGDDASKASRQRILDSIVPRLKEANVAVHTIALSENADHELLRSVSIATDGWYEQVDTADELQRVFLHLFEKAAQRDTVPLTDNNFKIDDSVNEMTLLVFRREGSKETELVLPDSSRIKNSELPANARWHHEDNYDLITIDDPLSGAWQIDAELDPDNRVMVVTDLKLQTSDLPNNILIGETFDFEASLTEKDVIIEREDFIKLVDAELKEENEITEERVINLNDAQQQGVYHANIGEEFQPGRNDVVVSFKSATFERQRRQSINVVETPFIVNMEQLTGELTRTHRLTLTPDKDLIKTENLFIAAMLTAQDGSEWSYDVMKNGDDTWQLTLADLQQGEEYTLALQIRGETTKNRGLFLQPTPIVLIDRDIPIAPPELPILEEEPEVQQDIVDELLPIEEPVEEELVKEEDEIIPELPKNTLPGIDEELLMLNADTQESEPATTSTLIIGNVIIIVLIGVAIVIWRRKAATVNPGDQL